ncbi:MAG: DUF512 domain-containing protein, partial [Coriobacteriales bacterium]|nr:DUF512 domain-containing protein [Coriobacteriales bacterium]
MPTLPPATPAAPANYAPTLLPGTQGPLIAAVDPGSPAEKVGLVPGMRVLSAEGKRLRDAIDWLWLAGEAEVRLVVTSALPSAPLGALPDVLPGTHEYVLTRSYGENWGINFADPLFDGLMTCRNSCLFCFMTMLPKGMRPSLYVRDDDYRLSFFQGNFVTLTNLSDADVQRIIDYHLSPLHVSLHAITPAVRKRLMGNNHARGIEALEQLLSAGIELHAQVVLTPGINSGAELDTTLAWVEERPNILSVGIVPYGFTRHARLQASFSVDDARAVIEQLTPFQERSRARNGTTRFQLADEWYLLAKVAPPPAAYYDDYPQFEDGIGMLRAFEDEWNASRPALISQLQAHSILVTGEAFAPTLKRLIAKRFAKDAQGPEVRAICNRFFGGNVNVAGLLTACDIIAQLKEQGLPPESTVFLPEAIFNADGLTLDDRT